MHLDNSHFIDITTDDDVSEAVKLLIEDCLYGRSKVTSLVLLQNAVDAKENELMEEPDEPSDEDPYRDRGVRRSDFV